jgi:hypothetical protein
LDEQLLVAKDAFGKVFAGQTKTGHWQHFSKEQSFLNGLIAPRQPGYVSWEPGGWYVGPAPWLTWRNYVSVEALIV